MVQSYEKNMTTQTNTPSTDDLAFIHFLKCYKAQISLRMMRLMDTTKYKVLRTRSSGVGGVGYGICLYIGNGRCRT